MWHIGYFDIGGQGHQSIGPLHVLDPHVDVHAQVGGDRAEHILDHLPRLVELVLVQGEFVLALRWRVHYGERRDLGTVD